MERPGRVAVLKLTGPARRLIALVGLLAVVVACSNAHTSSAARAPGQISGSGAGRSAGVLATQTPAPDPARQITYSSEITVRVRSVDKGIADVIKVTGDAGGFVFSQSAAFQSNPEASLSLRVGPDRFRPVLAQLASLGTILSQGVTAEDVTQQVTDLDGRLKTASASADRLRGLIARANSTADVVAIEAELAKREQDVESLQGQINALASRINYATINVKLTERGTAKVSKNIPGFRRGLHGGWVAFVNVGKALLTALGASLPFLPFIALALFAVVRYRRWRRAHPRPPQPARAQPWPGPYPGYGPGQYPQPAQPTTAAVPVEDEMSTPSPTGAAPQEDN